VRKEKRFLNSQAPGEGDVLDVQGLYGEHTLGELEQEEKHARR
jgi:hypothetical protein